MVTIHHHRLSFTTFIPGPWSLPTSARVYDYVRFEVFTAVTMKNCGFGTLRRVPLVRTDVSEKHSASIIRVTRIGELGTTLTVTSNRRTLRRNVSVSIYG
jgi:hypothetical protein